MTCVMNDPQTTATFASKLKQEREALGITIARLSELCYITSEHLEAL
jgi:cytoskeletal protein RodZ